MIKSLKPLEFDVLVTSKKNLYWGLDETLELATKRCKRGGGRAPFIVTLLPKGTEINGMTIAYPLTATFCATVV